MQLFSDHRYDIRHRGEGLTRHKVVTFCGKYIGKSFTVKGAKQIVLKHIKNRTIEQAEFDGY